ncbi:putative Fimbrial assembly family protein [Magnetofaba australis IT-1]|uniref:Putative Fimbrial assembly family protein n=1 Tax=Magnetofaba australis IT-1 TaxID=1434232 RepID=A0A1Y2K9A5_9PROT|nr:putative Fimbrial assembly family protein [Magnetofaba australis IT-1]
MLGGEGQLLLRRLDCQGVEPKGLSEFLALTAEETLPQGVDAYAIDHWRIDENHVCLAALPRDAMQTSLADQRIDGAQVTRVWMPELRTPPGQGVRLVLRHAAQRLSAYVWRDNILIDWCIFNAERQRTLALQWINQAAPEPPARVFVSGCSDPTLMAQTFAALWPRATVEEYDFNAFDPSQTLCAGVTFTAFLKELDNLPTDAGAKLRLGAAVAGFAAALLFLGFANLLTLEEQVQALERQVSTLKMRANRSNQVASRIGELTQQLDEIKTLTTERISALRALGAIGDTMPGAVALERIAIERSGLIALEGVADSELEVGHLLWRLSNADLFEDVRTPLLQKGENQDQAQVKFRIEMRLIAPLLTMPEEASEL